MGEVRLERPILLGTKDRQAVVSVEILEFDWGTENLLLEGFRATGTVTPKR